MRTTRALTSKPAMHARTAILGILTAGMLAVVGLWGEHAAGQDRAPEALPSDGTTGLQMPDGTRIAFSQAHVAARDRRRRIMHNQDTGWGMPNVDGSDIQALNDKWYAWMVGGENSQVDSISWCWSEGGWAPYPSKVLPVYDGYRKWLDAGVDPVRITLDESKKRNVEAFFSYRLNNEHDFSGSGGMAILPPMKKAHPEWLIPSIWPQVPVWNFEFQGVRDYKLSILREVARNYDFDGIEIDWRAGAWSLPQGHKWEKRAVLTDFMRSVRRMMLEEEKKKNKPMLLAARVSDCVEGCHFDGWDIETWAREGLVDILVIGGRSLEVDIAGFRRATRGTGVKLIPFIDDYHASTGYRQPPVEVFRGMAANWWAQEPDGVCTFNFAEYTDDGKPLMPRYQQVWREIGSPETLKFKDKTFVVQTRWGEGGIEGARMGLYFGTNRFAPLPAALTSDGNIDTLIPLNVGDDVSAYPERVDSLMLVVALSDATRPSRDDLQDAFEVTLNGVNLGRARIDEKKWLAFDVKPVHLAMGRNLVGVRIAKPDPAAKEEITVQKVELHVKYRPN